MGKCNSYCEHGGICILPENHQGLHDSKYCQWDDEHALTEEEADAVLGQTEHGEVFLTLKALVSPSMPEDWKL